MPICPPPNKRLERTVMRHRERAASAALQKTMNEADGIFVITAYDLTGKPLLAYRRRKRRKR